MFKTKTRKVILALALIAVLALGGTLAYLSVETKPINNQFTFIGAGQDGIDAVLFEPNWDPATALNLAPNAVVKKDPTVGNTGAIDIYTAIKVEFLDGNNKLLSDDDMLQFLRLVTLNNYGRNGWRLCLKPGAKASMTWYFTVPLQKGFATQPLFDSVTVNKANSNADMEFLKKLGLNIRVTGAGVQGSAFASANEASNDLYALLNP